MSCLKCALIQMTSTMSREENTSSAIQLIETAAKNGAQYVQTPEMTNLLVNTRKDLFERIEDEENTEEINVFRELAQQLGIWVHIGSMAIQTDTDKAANRSYMFSPEGKIVAKYDKIHMFDVNIDAAETYRESETYAPGSKAMMQSIAPFQLGFSICYDIRFSPLYYALARNGANVLAVPAAFTQPTGRAHWQTLLRARAIEFGSYVLAAAQTGEHQCGRKTYGHSIIIDPWGQVLAEAQQDIGIVYAELSIEMVEKARKKIPNLLNNQSFAL